MNKSSSAALALALAVALSTGGVLVRHPSPKDQAPGANSDILIVEDDSQRVVSPQSGEKPVIPPDKPQASTPKSDKLSGASSERSKAPTAT